MADRLRVHASCVAIGGHGVLIRGRPGSGKSDLALRLIDEPGGQARLVADDQVELYRDGARLLATAPAMLSGLLEIRGLGLVRFEPLENAALALIVDLDSTPERLPGFGSGKAAYLGIELPVLYLTASLASAPARVRAALAVALDPARLFA